MEIYVAIRKGNLNPVFRQIAEGIRCSLCLFSLNCLQQQITLYAKWHILGWHILIPSNGVLFPRRLSN